MSELFASFKSVPCICIGKDLLIFAQQNILLFLKKKSLNLGGYILHMDDNYKSNYHFFLEQQRGGCCIDKSTGNK